ncbi:lipid A export permease/ATP-binding protein MsbA [Dichelobacter nodosus]|uniref:lipid A export permease/ATP-binding protein MsbA n=1 Tax=Dichelobacter nodosus TaxID=870 RepID=UPI000E28EF39|nr:lipid A export permease/ATP-binding protein MsbA [Dichelobacter nodosus]AXM45025.1 lipid A export permease/ATP-binding protein MsbA [Dichelobacter nodosus]
MLNKEDKIRYLRLLGYLRPHWKMGVAAAVGTMIYGASELIIPSALQPMIDGGFAQGNMQIIYTTIAVLIAGFFVRGMANLSSAYTTTWIAQRVVYTLRVEMFAKLLRLPMPYFDHYSHGSILSRFSYDVTQLMSAVTDSLITLCRDTITIIALLAYLFYLDWQMTLIVMIAVPFVAFIIIYIAKQLRALARSLQEDMGGMNHIVDEVVRGREIIRMYDGFQHENQRFIRETHAIEVHALRSKKVAALISPILEMIIVLALSAVILLAAYSAQNHPEQMTIGKFVAFLGAMAMLFQPTKRLGKVFEPIQRGLAAAQSIFEFLDLPNEESLPAAEHSLEGKTIEFRNIRFAYGEQTVLEDFNLCIAAGETVALVGASGSGKSTIAALLAGFYPLQHGAIYIDGINVETLSLAQRRRVMAYVTQETVLFSGSIAENIAYADSDAPRERIIAAATAAYADDFIRQLPENYDSDIGQQGGRLSGGQKQRIAIARALYKNAPILILDEATSALDQNSEAKVQQAIEALQHKRTALIIAHRLTTIRHADRIVVLHAGKIIESGHHDALLAQNGVYAHMWQQTRGSQ